MYNTMPNFVLGFHGCDLSVYEKVLVGEITLKQSNNDYDWFGVYFLKASLSIQKQVLVKRITYKSVLETPIV